MKHIILLLVAVIVIVGGGYWILSQSTASTPTTGPAETQETPAQPTTDDVATAPAAPVDYVGLSEAEAAVVAEESNVPFRVVERDGEILPTTRDYRPGRINATVQAGIVTSYIVEGEREPVGSGASDDGDAAAPADGNNQGDPDANRYDFGVASPATDQEEGSGEAGGEHEAIIGMTEAEAAAYAEANNVPFRIGSVDGEARPVTMDYRPGRITAAIAEGRVTSYSVE